MKKQYSLLLLALFWVLQNVHAQTWNALGSGLGTTGESVKAIAVDAAGNIYAGGTFTGSIKYLAKWPSGGTAWESVGQDLDGPVYAILAKSANDIYVGGAFTHAGTTVVNHVARWSNNSWQTVGDGFNGNVYCFYLENFGGGNVYAGGEFNQSGTTAMNHIAKWNNASWLQIGNGISSVVNAVTLHNNVVYAGTNDFAPPNSPVKKYNPTSQLWEDVAGISGGKVSALASYNNELYAGGEFSQPVRAITKLDNTNNWVSIVTVFSNSSDKIYALLPYNGVLYVGGKFTNTGAPVAASYAAMKSATNQPIKSITVSNNQLNDEVYALGNLSGRVIVGGKFTTAGTTSLNHVAITSTTIGIDELSNIVVSKNLFPNPVSSTAHLNVRTTVKLNDPVLQILDLQSKLISTIYPDHEVIQNEVNFSIDGHSLSKGMYYYVLMENRKNVIADMFIVE